MFFLFEIRTDFPGIRIFLEIKAFSKFGGMSIKFENYTTIDQKLIMYLRFFLQPLVELCISFGARIAVAKDPMSANRFLLVFKGNLLTAISILLDENKQLVNPNCWKNLTNDKTLSENSASIAESLSLIRLKLCTLAN